jgi:hypothetical protein
MGMDPGLALTGAFSLIPPSSASCRPFTLLDGKGVPNSQHVFIGCCRFLFLAGHLIVCEKRTIFC